MAHTSSSAIRLPAEWEPHRATWIGWPHNPDDWPGKFDCIPWAYVEIVRHLALSEHVCIVALPYVEASARMMLAKAGVDLARVEFLPWPTDRGWLRDSGSIIVREGNERVALDWQFNAWAKYDNWRHDDQIASKMADCLRLRNVQPTRKGQRVVLEGGAIDSNGAGLLLTTEECLLGDVQARNPHLSRHDVEEVFAEYLGVRRVLWLGRGITGDDTHGHVDDLARFVAPRTVVTVTEDDRGDANYEPLRENLTRLRSMPELDVRTLPMPSPLFFDGVRLPASYANFYVANKCVLMPTFNDPRDREALTTLAELFPDREVIGIHAVDLVWGFGTLHCLTMQEPA
jgi:agmatine deiminase